MVVPALPFINVYAFDEMLSASPEYTIAVYHGDTYTMMVMIQDSVNDMFDSTQTMVVDKTSGLLQYMQIESSNGIAEYRLIETILPSAGSEFDMPSFELPLVIIGLVILFKWRKYDE